MTTPTPEFDALQSRRDEVARYSANASMYTQIAATLPSKWPDRLAHLKDATDQHAAAATVENLEDVELLGQLWAHDQAQAAIRSEMIERAKAQAILTVLEAQNKPGK